MKKNKFPPPLISVIIPCFNHGRFLKKSVESVRSQNIDSVEIIVVDDGSSDNTFRVAKSLNVQYIRQANSGPSSARNTGIKRANGTFLVFLDADDWLLPGSLKINMDFLINNTELAFVSGAHEKVFEKRGVIYDVLINVEREHYNRMLEGNYIGMLATVMYRSWVFDEFLFDTSLKMCEDYDLFLRITCKYPVAHHTKKIAAYRFHGVNSSDNTPKMLDAALNVLERQKSHLRTKTEKQAYKTGVRFWINYYTKELYMGLQANRKSYSFENIYQLLKYKPTFAIKLFIKKLMS